MKKLLLFVLLLVSVVANAQKGISYQAVVLDPAKIEIPGSDISGQPLVNGNISVKFVILSGTTSQFEEVQQTKTDAYGLVNLTIGSVASTAFNAITWDAVQKSLQVYVSFDNGSSYTKVSDQKLTYTPYALFAETAGKLGSTLGIAGGGTGATTAVGARANLGLGNVDNTADVDKPISSATKAALDLKANVADVNAALALKATVAALEAHMATTADTTMLATKAALTDLNDYAPINSPTFTGIVSGINKSMVGLGSVDNTADAAKPISTATQAALNLKANAVDVNSSLALKANIVDMNTALALKATTTELSLKAPLASPTFTGTVSGITKSMVGLGFVDNTSDAAKPISTATQAALNTKASLNSPTFSGTITSGSNFSGNGRIKILSNNNTYNDAVGNQLFIDSYVKTYTGPAGNIPVYSTAYINANTLFSSQNSITIDNATALHLLPPTNYNVVASKLWALYAEGNIKSLGSMEATGFRIPNGTSSQYLMADGSVSSGSGSSLTNLANSVTGVLGVANGGTGQTSLANFKGELGLSSNNVAIGSQAGTPNQGVNANTVAIGGGAGNSGQGQSAIGIGYVAGYANQGANGIAIGSNTAQSNQASQAVALGYAAGQYGQGQNAVAIGSFAGNNAQVANSIALNATGASLNPTNAGFYVDPVRSTTATSNLLYYNTSTKEITTGTGSFVDLTTAQTIAGVKTFSSNISANGVSLGRGAGNNDESVAIGQGAMGASNVNGKRNTAVGAGAMRSYNGTAWDNNTSIGYNNLPSMTSGSGNTSVGAESMLANVTGTENTSIGNQSLINTTGNNNVGVGKRSGQTITSGSQNTIIGTDADVSSATLTNATALGYGANVAASNTIQLGNSNVTNVKTNGTITAGAVTYPRVDGTAGQVLTTNGSGALSWATPTTLYQKTHGDITLSNTVGELITLTLPAGSYLVTYTGMAYQGAGSGSEYVASRISTTNPGNLSGGDAIMVSRTVNDGRAYIVHQLGITLASAGTVSVFANTLYGNNGPTIITGARLTAVQVGALINQ